MMSFKALFAALAAASSFGTAVAAPSPYKFYNMPTALAGPCDLATGHDGNIYGQDILKNKLFKIEYSTGVVTEYDIPYTTPAGDPSALPGTGTVTALACAVRAGNDGKIYAASGLRNQFVRLDPPTGKVTVFTPEPYNPLGDLLFLNDVWCAQAGCYFTSTSANLIWHYDYHTEKFNSFTVPTPASFPVGMIVTPDQAVWFAEFTGNKVGRLNATTGQFTEIPVPALEQGPAVVRALTQGKYLWFTGFLGNSMIRCNIETHKVDVYPIPWPETFPTEDTVDAHGKVWFSSPSYPDLFYIDSNTLEFSKVPQPAQILPNPLGKLTDFVTIAVNYGTGNAIYFTHPGTNQVGRYQLSGSV